MTANTTTRRAVLAGTAALPALAMALPAAAQMDDPAIAAARAWIAAAMAEQAYGYQMTGDWDDDPHAVALTDEERRCWQALLDTPPTTGDGLALMLACFLYAVDGSTIGAHFSDPDSWYPEGTGKQGALYAILPALWKSPAAASLFPRTTPPCDPQRIADALAGDFGRAEA